MSTIREENAEEGNDAIYKLIVAVNIRICVRNDLVYYFVGRKEEYTKNK
jgi:hypothetical protein